MHAPPVKRHPDSKRRDPQVHHAILRATVELLEAVGYKRLTVEAIAARAGVGKQTIYRWWPGKTALVMEAYADAATERAPEPDTGSVRGDVEAILLPVFALHEDYGRGTVLANKSMMAEALIDRDFLRTYRRLHESWQAPLIAVLERGKARGELRPETDSAALVDIMLGASWYRLMLEHAPLDEHFAEVIISSLLAGNRPASIAEPRP